MVVFKTDTESPVALRTGWLLDDIKYWMESNEGCALRSLQRMVTCLAVTVRDHTPATLVRVVKTIGKNENSFVFSF